MSSTIYINGKEGTWSSAIEAPYLYQQVRTQGYQPLRLAEHCRLLSFASQRLFDRVLNADIQELEQSIAAILAHDRYSKELSHIVEIRLYSESDYAVFAVESSLYGDFELRAIRPRALIHSAEIGFGDMPTSAARAHTELLRKYGEKYGCACVVCADHNGIVGNIDGAAVMAVIDREIVVSQAVESVEKSLMIERLRECRHENVVVRDISVEELRRAEEIFYIDVRGITSISELEGEVLSDFVANAVGDGVQTNDDDIEILA